MFKKSQKEMDEITTPNHLKAEQEVYITHRSEKKKLSQGIYSSHITPYLQLSGKRWHNIPAPHTLFSRYVPHRLIVSVFLEESLESISFSNHKQERRKYMTDPCHHQTFPENVPKMQETLGMMCCQ